MVEELLFHFCNIQDVQQINIQAIIIIIDFCEPLSYNFKDNIHQLGNFPPSKLFISISSKVFDFIRGLLLTIFVK